jgi:hypothetical protein
MKKQQIVAIFLSILTLMLVACTLVAEQATPRIVIEETSTETGQPGVQAAIAVQLQATAIPVPVDSSVGGFSYYEDVNRPPGYDPLFAVCNGKAIRLMQNVDGWDIERMSAEDFARYKPLNPTAQRSDFMRYVYLPSLGEIHLVDGYGNDQKLVMSFHNEYNPEYWIWAWSSLMFIKDCRLRVFYIRSNGTSQFYKYDF